MKFKYDDNNKDSIENYAKQLEGLSLKTFVKEFSMREVSNSNYLNSIDYKGKGKLGQLIENTFFGYDLNSRQEADFVKVGIELKVAPIKEIKKQKSSSYLIKRKGLSAKERIVLTMIDYFKLADEEWDNATVRRKIKLLLMFYVYNKEVEVDEQLFYLVNLWEPSDEDLEIIKKDWKLIRNKVRNGIAHEISEGDTMYLGACTKGINRKSVRKQPYNQLEAPQRAFSLKRNYVDFILEELLQGRVGKLDKVITTLSINVFDELTYKLNQNSKISLSEIIEKNFIERKRISKNFISLVTKELIEKIFNKPFKEITELDKSGIIVTVPGVNLRTLRHLIKIDIEFTRSWIGTLGLRMSECLNIGAREDSEKRLVKNAKINLLIYEAIKSILRRLIV